MTTRTKGRLAAFLILLAAAAVTWLAVVNSKTNTPTAEAPGTDPDSMLLAPKADKTVTTSLGVGGHGGPVQDLVSMADEAVFTRVNRETGELEYRMTWASLDPQEGGIFRLTTPRAWIYERNQIIEVTANTGRLRWPSRESEPESGLLEGDVVIVARRQDTEAESAAEPGEELLRIRTPSLNFHTTLGELRTAEIVQVHGPGMSMTGVGLTIRFSQERARPLTYFRIDEGGRFDYEPVRSARTSRGQASEATTNPSKTGKASSSLTDRIALYRAQFTGSVRLTTPGRTVESEQAHVWARLFDGKLTPGAIGTWESSRPRRDDLRSKSSDTAVAETSQISSESGFTLTWTGPLEARAMLEDAAELAHNDVFLRLLSPSGGGVRLADVQSGASLTCVSLDYGATTRTMAMFGAGPIGVTLAAPDLINVSTGRFELDLTTGIGAFPSPGIARAIGKAAEVDDPAFEPGQRSREIRWQERLDFRLDTSAGPVGLDGVIVPQDLLLRGSVEARDGNATLRGDTIRAVFDQATQTSVTSDRVVLNRLVAEGSAFAEDGIGARIVADSLDVAFKTDEDTGRTSPKFAGARGNVRADRDGESLRAGMVDATLHTDENGKTEISSLEARLGVETRISRQEEGESALSVISVSAERMNADRMTGIVDLQGSPASIGRTRGAESALISGTSLRLFDMGSDRGMTVFGAGNGSVSLPQQGEDAYARAHVEWRSSMNYNDRSGRLEAIGGVTGFAEIGESERHTLKGERLSMELGSDAAGKRALTRAVIEGAVEPGDPAEVELRTYAAFADGAAPRLEGMVFLRGPSIELDSASSAIHMPGAGLLLIEDRRMPSNETRKRNELEEHGFRGTTVFEWTGEMSLSRESGRGEMTNGVRVRHRHMGGGGVTELHCEQLQIYLGDATAGSEGESLQLERAEAIGAVFARHKSLELVADRMIYHAARGVIMAAAAPGNRVTVYDEAKGRHFVAEAAEVDLATGSWKATRVSAQMFGK